MVRTGLCAIPDEAEPAPEVAALGRALRAFDMPPP
jgi:hypothetical protein